MEKELDLKVVVVTKGGGGSQIGVTEYLAKAGTDGYTILAANTPVTISPYMDPSRKATYHLGRDIVLDRCLRLVALRGCSEEGRQVQDPQGSGRGSKG